MQPAQPDHRTTTAAIEELRWAYRHQHEANERLLASGRNVIALTSNTVPVELIRASGCVPMMLGNYGSANEFATQWLEPVFERRVRQIFDFIMAGGLERASGLIIPRTSEPEYKLFLYLKELHRAGVLGLEPYLLHSRSANSRSYGLRRTMDLWKRLTELGNRDAGEADLRAAIREGNLVRAAIRRLLVRPCCTAARPAT